MKQPILKFKREHDGVEEYIEMKVDEFQWPKGGTAVCPLCGEKVIGIGKDWNCEGEECKAHLYGPIF